MVEQFDIYWVDLNPIVGAEMQKIRPCVIVSPKTLGRGVVELATRDKSVKEDVALADAPARVLALIQELKDQVWAKVPESI